MESQEESPVVMIDKSALAANIKESPLAAVGIATGAGFIVGGGLNTWIGRLILVSAMRIAAPKMIMDAIAGLGNNNGKRHRSTRSTARAGKGTAA